MLFQWKRMLMDYNKKTYLVYLWMSIIEPFSDISTICDKSSYLGSHTINAFYFPQFQNIFYLRLTADVLKKETLNRFVRGLIEANIQAFQGIIADPYQQSLKFEQLVDHPSPLAGNIQMKWNKQNRVIVRFNGRDVNAGMVDGRNKLMLKLSLDEVRLIEYDIYRQFQVRDIYVLQKLTSYRFTALRAGNTILKHYDALEKIEVTSQTTEVFPLFTFQVFYHQMQQLSIKVKHEVFFERLLTLLDIHQIQVELLRKLYGQLQSNHMDKMMMELLLNHTRKSFSITSQRQFVLDYFHGNIDELGEDDRCLMASLMLQLMEKLPATQAECLFMVEDYDQLNTIEAFKQQQIVRIEVFCRANSYLRQMDVRSGKEYQIYQIYPLTARPFTPYSLASDQLDHIILPFNDYLIEEKRKQGKKHFIKLRELPTPKCLNTNLVVWISDDFREGRQFQQRSVILNNQNNQEVMLIKDIRTYQIWLRRYYPTIASRKVCVVYQGKVIRQGLETLELTRNYLGAEIILVFYTESIKHFSEQLGKRVQNLEKIKVTNSYRSVLNFVVSSLKPSGVIDCDCQSCQCDIW